MTEGTSRTGVPLARDTLGGLAMQSRHNAAHLALSVSVEERGVPCD